MPLTKCYYVVYHVADFAADNEFICHQDAYRDHNNALLVAKDLAKCLDVADNVFVIDGLTGEVLNTILKDAPQEDKAEEDGAPADNTEKNNAPAPADTYKDKNGDTWFRISDGRWRIDCANRHCADCPYYSEEGDCIVQEPLHDADRNYQVELARLKMLAKAKKTEEEENSISTIEFNDGTDGVWHPSFFCLVYSLTKALKCVRMARGADIRNAPNLLLYHPAQFLSRVFSHKFHQIKS